MFNYLKNTIQFLQTRTNFVESHIDFVWNFESSIAVMNEKAEKYFPHIVENFRKTKLKTFSVICEGSVFNQSISIQMPTDRFVMKATCRNKIKILHNRMIQNSIVCIHFRILIKIYPRAEFHRIVFSFKTC